MCVSIVNSIDIWAFLGLSVSFETVNMIDFKYHQQISWWVQFIFMVLLSTARTALDKPVAGNYNRMLVARIPKRGDHNRIFR